MPSKARDYDQRKLEAIPVCQSVNLGGYLPILIILFEDINGCVPDFDDGQLWRLSPNFNHLFEDTSLTFEDGQADVLWDDDLHKMAKLTPQMKLKNL